MCACENGNETIVKYLVDHGADVNLDCYDRYALNYACSRNGNKIIVKYLVELGADVNHVEPNGNTPLSEACIFVHETIIKYLIEKGADMNLGCPLVSACGYDMIM